LTAKQCKLYLEQNPGLTKEHFNEDSKFREIALQKVGKTGYTGILEIPDMKTGAYINWVDPVNKRIGKDITLGINSLSEKQASAIWKIYHAAVGRNEAKGYYPWADKKGRLKDKFMHMKRIQKTPYFLVALTFIDDYTQPMLELETRAQIMTAKTRNVGLGILGATILIIGLLVSLYGMRLSNSIAHLTDVAERISIGELDAKVGISSTDEIGRLAEAISRMQDSLNLSIQRLRRRR
jgi:methyl-accepting chemotaxis protein